MSLASEIPVRANGEDILAGWFNTIRTALLNLLGSESIIQTLFAGLASQTSTDVTSLVFDKTVTRRAFIEYTIVTATKVESGDYVFLYDGANWTSYSGSVQGVASGVTLDVNTSTGQAEYTSGGETFNLNYKATTFNI